MEHTTGATGHPDAAGRRSPALILVLTAVAFFMVALDGLVVVTAAALIAARAVQGVAAAAVTPLSLTIATSAFPPARRGSVMGIIGAIAGLAVAGGPLVGGVVV
jgi:MFS family permease